MLTVLYMAIMSRLSGSGYGKQWGVSWLPELMFALAIGIAHSGAWYVFDAPYYAVVLSLIIATGISFGFMQSGTWMFLRWESHDDPNTTRGGTLKGICDWIAGKFGWKLGDEGYAWVAASVKGFLIGLPIGGLPLALLWPLGYEIGSHAEGRVERYGMDAHAIKELLAGAGAGLAILIFVAIINAIR